MLFKVVTLAFVVLLLLIVLLQGFSILFFNKSKQNNNPQFTAFQKSYLLFSSLILCSDWLNAPYLYKLYSSYGFIEEQIVIIYVCGLISVLVFDVLSGYLVIVYNDKKLFKLSTLLYATSCTMKLSSDYSTLILGRILCGCATSLMFASQESLHIKQHTKVHDFPLEWIAQTKAKVSKASSFVALSAGIIAYLSTEFLDLGATMPTIVSIPIVLFSSYIVPDVKPLNPITNLKSLTHAERKEQGRIYLKSYIKGMKKIAGNQQLFIIGTIKALFESVICLFVFLWTPVLDHHNPPLGLVFASFMAANLIGYFVYERVSTKNVKFVILIVLCMATFAVLSCAISTKPTQEFPVVSFLSFLIFEFASGLYFPVIDRLEKETDSFELLRIVNAWLKIPINILGCFGLLMLHSSTNTSGTRHIFLGCTITLSIATFVAVNLKSVKNNILIDNT